MLAESEACEPCVVVIWGELVSCSSSSIGGPEDFEDGGVAATVPCRTFKGECGQEDDAREKEEEGAEYGVAFEGGHPFSVGLCAWKLAQICQRWYGQVREN